MINSVRVTLVTLAGVTFGGWVSAQTAVPGASAQPFIYPSKGQTAQQEEKDKYACYGWASQQTGFDPAQELEEQQAAAARARQQSQQAQQTAVQQFESTQGQGVGGAARGAAGGAIIGAIAGDAGRARRSVPQLDCWQDGTVAVRKKLQRQISSCRPSSRSRPNQLNNSRSRSKS